MNYIPGHGNAKARIVIVGESPNAKDSRAFQSNKELYSLLGEAGILPGDCWFTNVSKYFIQPNPPKGKKIPFQVRAKLGGVNLQQQLAELRNEIASVNPNIIVALGNTALWATTGISGKASTKKMEDGSFIDTTSGGIGDYRGSILVGYNGKVIPTYNPEQLNTYGNAEFKGYWNRSVILFDLRRARAQAEYKEIRRPPRTLEICKSADQLSRFLVNYRQSIKPSIDIEARGKCIPNCVGISFRAGHGLTIPLWNTGEIESVCHITQYDMIRMWILLGDYLGNHEVVGQNLKYDQDKLARLGFAFRGVASDTLLKSFALNSELPKSLAFLTSVYTEEPFYKNEGMYEGRLEDLLIGCARDACVTKEIDIALEKELEEVEGLPYYHEMVLPLHQFYLDIDNEGMNIDAKTRDELFRKYISWSERLSYELFCLVGEPVNVRSSKQVSILLYDNFGIPRRSGAGEEVITEILNLQNLKLTDDQRRVLEIILEKRRVELTISTYLAVLPDYDGKVRTSYFPCLDTGRSSTSQLEPPIRPTVEVTDETGKTKNRPIGIAFQTMTKHGDIGADVRAMYVPDPGHVFIQADSAQAEARVVFLLADDEDALTALDTHDYHALTASWFFGGSESDYSKATLGYEHPIRFVGKTLRHAGHLGAGKKRAAATVNTDARKFKINVKITEKFADEALKTFHAKQPKIRGNFHHGVETALQRDRRVLYSGIPFGLNVRLGGRRQFFERWGDELFRQSYSYIPQRSVSDNTKAAGLRIKKHEPRLARCIIEAHDALVYMIPEKEVNYFAGILKEELERPIRFDTCSIPRRPLSIPCEVEVGYNYKDLKKMKV